MRLRTKAVAALSLISCSCLLSCATNEEGTPNLTPHKDGSVSETSTGGTDGGKDVAVEDVVTLDVNNKDTGTATGDVTVYAHDRDSLYELDPNDSTYALKPIGKFDCLSENGERTMTDLAINKDGELFGVSTGAVFLHMTIDKANHQVHCKSGMVKLKTNQGGTVPRFYGLTFAPATTQLGASETLIGANTLGELYVINTQDGSLTLVGNLGTVPHDDGWGHNYPSKNVGKPWALSGDVVFLSNKGSPVGFATVRDCPDPSQAPYNCSHVDTLIEIDISKLSTTSPGNVLKKVRGQVLPTGCDQESCGYGSIYGIAAFKSKVFGFTYNWIDKDHKTGHIITIDNDTGAANLVKDTALSMDGFAGAGVTTIAPIIPPK